MTTWATLYHCLPAHHSRSASDKLFHLVSRSPVTNMVKGPTEAERLSTCLPCASCGESSRGPIPMPIHGTSKGLFPRFVKLGEKVVFCLPILQTGERNFFTPHSHNLGRAF